MKEFVFISLFSYFSCNQNFSLLHKRGKILCIKFLKYFLFGFSVKPQLSLKHIFRIFLHRLLHQSCFDIFKFLRSNNIFLIVIFFFWGIKSNNDLIGFSWYWYVIYYSSFFAPPLTFDISSSILILIGPIASSIFAWLSL